MPSRDCSIRFAGLRVREVTHGSQKLLPVPRMRRRHPVALHASRSLIASRIGSATTFCCRWHGGALQAPLRPRFSDYSMLVCRVEPVRTRQPVRRIQAAVAASDRRLTFILSSGSGPVGARRVEDHSPPPPWLAENGKPALRPAIPHACESRHDCINTGQLSVHLVSSHG